MSNTEGKRKNIKLRHKVLNSFPKWFRVWITTGRRNGFPKGNNVHPYDWDYLDECKRKQKFLKEKEKYIE